MRYGSLDFVLNSDIDFAIDLINKANEKERDKRFFYQWVVQLPYMTKEDYMSFSEYKEMLTFANVDLRPREEIEKEILELHKQKGGNSNGNGDI